jgi:hypothetical protein
LYFHLRNGIQHIAFMLLAIFTGSFIPFNLLHHHAEDGHYESRHQHQVEDSHHCELDDYFCDTAPETDCGHESHLHKTLTKCFACEFQFIKHFEGSTFTVRDQLEEQELNYKKFISSGLREAAIRLSNKGPPALM